MIYLFLFSNALSIVGFPGVVRLGGPVSRCYRLVPQSWGLVNYFLFTIVPMSNKIQNNWLIFLSHFILNRFTSMLYVATKCHNPLCQVVMICKRCDQYSVRVPKILLYLCIIFYSMHSFSALPG